MNKDTFELELKNFDKLTDEQVREKLELLVGAPMTYEGYQLAYWGMFSLMHACGVTKQDERFREAVYRRVVRTLEEEPDPTDHKAGTGRQIDYATSLLSHFMNPPVPPKYVSQLQAAAQKCCERQPRDSLTDFLRQVIGCMGK